MAPVLLYLLLLLSVSNISTTITTPDTAVPLAALTDLSSFVYRQYGRNFSDRWKECIEGGPDKCPYRSVGVRGPCQEGEIFVYNRTEALRTNGSFEPVCQPPPCPDGYSLVIPDKKCYHDDDIVFSVCLPPRYLQRNPFGEYFCGCEGWDATLLGSKKKECHRLLTQGPCAEGSLFVPVNDLVNFGQGQCLPSPCIKLFNTSAFLAEIRLPNGRTECFDGILTNPCKKKLLVVDHSDDSVFPGLRYLQCKASQVGPAFGFATREKCVVNNEGVCVFPLKHKPVEPHPLYLEES